MPLWRALALCPYVEKGKAPHLRQQPGALYPPRQGLALSSSFPPAGLLQPGNSTEESLPSFPASCHPLGSVLGEADEPRVCARVSCPGSWEQGTGFVCQPESRTGWLSPKSTSELEIKAPGTAPSLPLQQPHLVRQEAGRPCNVWPGSTSLPAGRPHALCQPFLVARE